MTMLTESQTLVRPVAPARFIATIANHIAAFRLSRRTLRDFAAMDDHILQDIGLSRADVDRASLAELGTDRMAMLDRARARRLG